MLKVGDKGKIVHWDRHSTRQGEVVQENVVITKVARRWATAVSQDRWKRESKVDMETGMEDAGQFTPVYRFMTDEMLAQEERIEENWATLQSVGFDRVYRAGGPSVELLEALANTVREVHGG